MHSCKKNFYLILILLMWIPRESLAQVNKGRWLTGASIGGIFYNNESADFAYPTPTSGYITNRQAYGITINPFIARFFTDVFAAGIQITGGYTKQENRNEAGGNTYAKADIHDFNFSVNPFARYYFTSDLKLNFFTQFLIGAGTGKYESEGFFYSGTDYKDTYSTESNDVFRLNAGISLGASRNISRLAALEISGGYFFSKTKSRVKSFTSRDEDLDGIADAIFQTTNRQKNTLHSLSINAGFIIFLK